MAVEAHDAIFDWQRSDWWIAFAHERPITAELVRVLFARAFELGSPPYIAERLASISGDMTEISTWIALPREPSEQETKQALDGWLKAFADAGCPPLKLVELARAQEQCQRAKPGRPIAATREIATRFLDAKSKDPKLSYRRFMNRNCTCKNQDHLRCAAALRQQVIHLKKILRKFDIPYPVQST